MWQTEEEEGVSRILYQEVEEQLKGPPKKAGGSFRGMSTQLEPKRLFWDFVRFFLLLKPIWRDGTVGSNSNMIFFHSNLWELDVRVGYFLRAEMIEIEDVRCHCSMLF